MPQQRRSGQVRYQHRLGLAHPPQHLVHEVPVYYYPFDVLYADGQDPRPLPPA
jgi:ATP-dependent DNA ligase